MRSVFREHLIEAIVGVAVVLLAIWFVLFAWQRTGGGGSERGGQIHVTALFPSASGVNVGTDVRIAGLKVGAVSAQRLDPKSFQAELVLALDGGVKVPSDSSVAVTSEGLLGGTFLALVPGGAETPLKDGDTILDTQGSTDLMGLIGQFINKSGDTPKDDASKGEGAAAPAEAK